MYQLIKKAAVAAVAFISCVQFGYGQIGKSTLGVSHALGLDSVARTPLLAIDSVSINQSCISQCSSTLPVTGLKLEAKRLNKYEVLLNWSTLTEINNKGFNIQRSLSSATTFENTGFITGVGNSVQKIKYKLVDNNPFSGITYYRLQQLDLDGRITYSNIVDVKGIANKSFTISPNPAQASATLSFSEALSNKPVTVSILDISGKLTFQKVYSSGQGSSIKLENISYMKPGTYIVTVTDGEQKLFGKLTIAR